MNENPTNDVGNRALPVHHESHYYLTSGNNENMPQFWKSKQAAHIVGALLPYKEIKYDIRAKKLFYDSDMNLL